MTRSIALPGWPRPRGYAHGMAARGECLAVAGQIAWDETETIVSDEMAAQFRQSLENVVAVVRQAGGEPADIISMTVYVTDKHEYINAARTIGEHWRETMGTHYPAMALMQVSALLEDRAKVEIQALAILAQEHQT